MFFLTVPTVWVVQREEAEAEREAKKQEARRLAEEAKARKAEIRLEAGLPAQPAGKQE